MGSYELRPYRPGDEEGIVRAAALAFGAGEAGFHPRTLEEWRWLYERNPAGRRIWVATHAGEVVGHFATCPHRMRLVGGETVFARIQDPFVLPAHRAGTGPPGLLVDLGLSCYEATAGPDADVVGFCWPNDLTEAAGETWSVGEKHLGYEVVRTQGLLRRAPGAGPTELPERASVLERFDEQALWLYDRCGGVWGASVVRDEAYFNWRYATHPRHAYVPLGVRDEEGILRGLAVVRRAPGPAWSGPGAAVLTDWLVPPEEPEVAERLYAALFAYARSEGAAELVALFPEWSPWFAELQERGWRVHPSDHTTVAIQHHPTYEMHWLRDHWWYQLGETDLV